MSKEKDRVDYQRKNDCYRPCRIEKILDKISKCLACGKDVKIINESFCDIFCRLDYVMNDKIYVEVENF